MSTQPTKVGLIGLSAGGSWASRAHLPYLSTTPNYTITALLNSSTSSAESAGKKYSLTSATAHDSITSLLSADIDLVAVSVKVPHHAEFIEPALKAKKPVFSEWPLGESLAEAEHLASLAAENGVRTMVGLQARQNPAVLKAKEIIENGELGQILGTNMDAWGLLYGGGRTTQDIAYACPIENGANLLTIPFGHAVDALCYVLGEFKDLQATLANNRPTLTLIDTNSKPIKELPKSAHDHIAVIGNLQRGGVASVVYRAGMSQTDKNFHWEINGTKGSLVLEAAFGHLQMAQPTLKMVKFGGEGARLEEVEVPGAEESVEKGYAYNVGRAWDAFAGKGYGCVVTFGDAVVRHRMIEAIYRSDEKGTRESYM